MKRRTHTGNGCTFVAKPQLALRGIMGGMSSCAAEAFNSFYGIQSAKDEIRQPVTISVRTGGGSSIYLQIVQADGRKWLRCRRLG